MGRLFSSRVGYERGVLRPSRDGQEVTHFLLHIVMGCDGEQNFILASLSRRVKKIAALL